MELQKEIEEFEIKIEKKRRALRTAMNENHDPFIHKFPPEIASHIFIQYAPPHALFAEDERSTPLYLGAVCQKWRQLAWATPQLWSSSLIGFHAKGRYSTSNGSDLLQLVTEWLDRTASLPLTIGFDQPFEEVHGDGVYHDVINILNKHSAKWYDVHFDLPARHLHRLCGSSQGNMIRRLALRNYCLSIRDSDIPKFSMKSKPSPTGLTLVEVSLLHVDIIWNNLTVASVNSIGVDECFELIRRAPLLENLTLCRIHDDASSDLFPIPNTRIVLPHLQSLELSNFWEEDVVAKILDSVCLPSLKQWIHDRSPFPLDNMIKFIGCLSSRLKRLKMGIDCGHLYDENQLPTFLYPLSSLEFLELRIDDSSGEKFFNILCASAQSPLFLPQLQSLELTGPYPCPMWKCAFQIFTVSHRQSLRVKVNCKYGRIEDETLKQLLELDDRGFDLSFVNGKIDLLQKYRKEWPSRANRDRDVWVQVESTYQF
jgi:hypothetical protein